VDNSNELIMDALKIDEKVLMRYITLLMEKFSVSTHEALKEAAKGVISTVQG
jgi:hypothetical protein